jgi:hypothetical protein
MGPRRAQGRGRGRGKIARIPVSAGCSGVDVSMRGTHGTERRGARTSQIGTSAPREERVCRVLGAGLHAGRAKHVQVQPGRRGRVLRPLFSFRGTRLFLTLSHYRKACHDGRDGNQSDT